MDRKLVLFGLTVLTALVVALGAYAAAAPADVEAQEPIAYGIQAINVACWPGSGPGSGNKLYAFAGTVFSDMQGDEQENRVEGVWIEGVFTADCTKKTSTVSAYSNEWGLADVVSSVSYRRGCTVHWDIDTIVSPPGYVYDPDLSVGESAVVTCE